MQVQKIHVPDIEERHLQANSWSTGVYDDFHPTGILAIQNQWKWHASWFPLDGSIKEPKGQPTSSKRQYAEFGIGGGNQLRFIVDNYNAEGVGFDIATQLLDEMFEKYGIDGVRFDMTSEDFYGRETNGLAGITKHRDWISRKADLRNR